MGKRTAATTGLAHKAASPANHSVTALLTRSSTGWAGSSQPATASRADAFSAGGTASSIGEFGRGLPEENQREAKQPDFVSRLRGYLNVLGPNPQLTDGPPETDRFHQLRRAILLRSLLERKAPNLIPEHPATVRRALSLLWRGSLCPPASPKLP